MCQLGTKIKYKTYKPTQVQAHVGIEGNERANELAKIGSGKDHIYANQPYERAHTLPHYYQRKEWPFMDETPYKVPM